MCKTNDMNNEMNGDMRRGRCCGKGPMGSHHDRCHHEHGHGRGRGCGAGDREPGEGCGEGMRRHHHHHMDEETYAALPTDAKLGMTFHKLNRMSRFIMGSCMGQRRILGILAEDGAMTQRELTERLGVRPGSASELIGKLERAGLIARTENAEDRRTADVSLTEGGRQALADADRDRPDMFAGLTEEEKEQLLALLEKLRADWKERFPRGGAEE